METMTTTNPDASSSGEESRVRCTQRANDACDRLVQSRLMLQDLRTEEIHARWFQRVAKIPVIDLHVKEICIRMISFTTHESDGTGTHARETHVIRSGVSETRARESGAGTLVKETLEKETPVKETPGIDILVREILEREIIVNASDARGTLVTGNDVIGLCTSEICSMVPLGGDLHAILQRRKSVTVCQAQTPPGTGRMSRCVARRLVSANTLVAARCVEIRRLHAALLPQR